MADLIGRHRSRDAMLAAVSYSVVASQKFRNAGKLVGEIRVELSPSRFWEIALLDEQGELLQQARLPAFHLTIGASEGTEKPTGAEAILEERVTDIFELAHARVGALASPNALLRQYVDIWTKLDSELNLSRPPLVSNPNEAVIEWGVRNVAALEAVVTRLVERTDQQLRQELGINDI